MTAFLVVNGTSARRVEAETVEEAALEAARTTSVGSLRTGVTFAIYPLDFCQKVRVQYERPAEGGDHGFGDNLGQLRVVDEFVEVPKLGLVS